ncbi:MAG: nickel pincer cofactor biosynthesis protein LarB [Coriobacteriales bacterium]|nr:nickel pincer cofactor biosynthesis protein LarB [Coriobacteriales bacterium]
MGSTHTIRDAQSTGEPVLRAGGGAPTDGTAYASDTAHAGGAAPTGSGAESLAHFADLDFDRSQRCGFPEVVYGAGKTPEQVVSIVAALLEHHEVALVTRASAEHAQALKSAISDSNFVASCGLLYVDRRALPLRIEGETAPAVLEKDGGGGNVLVCCAGTSDLSVAEEAAVTARIMGSHTTLLTDIGVAGVHRTLRHQDTLRQAHVIVVVAGMEGALPSLVAGLVDVPVIAVPTSVGYGASFGGVAALLGMLNSCAGGVSVVNIDNGFGAGLIAHRINRPPERFAQSAASSEYPTTANTPATTLTSESVSAETLVTIKAAPATPTLHASVNQTNRSK